MEHLAISVASVAHPTKGCEISLLGDPQQLGPVVNVDPSDFQSKMDMVLQTKSNLLVQLVERPNPDDPITQLEES